MLAALGKGFYGNFGLKHVFKDILRGGIKHRPKDGLGLLDVTLWLKLTTSVIPGSTRLGTLLSILGPYLDAPKKFK